MKMTEGLWAAIIGVAGTLLGTALGWFLNVFSNKGKLKFYVSSWEDEFEKNEMGEMIPATNTDDVECYAYKCFLDIYNSSNETKIMRDIQVVFSDEKNEWNSVIPKDYNTLHGTHINCYDDILPLNIPPKTILKVVLYNYWWASENNLDFLWKSKVVFLRYTDENNKVKEIKINDEKYAEYFEKHSI
jgi:hypothetical protein